MPPLIPLPPLYHKTKSPARATTTPPPTTLPAMRPLSEEDEDPATVADELECTRMPVGGAPKVKGAPKVATVEGPKVVTVGITTDVVRGTGLTLPQSLKYRDKTPAYEESAGYPSDTRQALQPRKLAERSGQ